MRGEVSGAVGLMTSSRLSVIYQRDEGLHTVPLVLILRGYFLIMSAASEVTVM